MEIEMDQEYILLTWLETNTKAGSWAKSMVGLSISDHTMDF